jgi:hypothetical protein
MFRARVWARVALAGLAIGVLAAGCQPKVAESTIQQKYQQHRSTTVGTNGPGMGAPGNTPGGGGNGPGGSMNGPR